MSFGLDLLHSGDGESVSWLVSAFGEEIEDASGNVLNCVEALDKKFVGVFFGASWCPPAKVFAKHLVDFYNRVRGNGFAFEVVYVSCDESKKAHREYLQEANMPWYSLSLKSDAIDTIKSKFPSKTIPALVILDSEGRLISRNARNDIGKLDITTTWKLAAQSLETAPIIAVPAKMRKIEDTLALSRRNRVWSALGRVALYPLREDYKCTTGASSVYVSKAPFASSGIYLNGLYGEELAYEVRTPNLLTDLDSFSVSVDFSCQNRKPGWLVVGGSLHRWFGVEIRPNSHCPVVITFNNQSVVAPFLEGTTIDPQTWYNLVVSVNSVDGLVTCLLGDTTTESAVTEEVKLPESFSFDANFRDILEKDGHLVCCNKSNGGAFKGLLKNLVVFNRDLQIHEILDIYGTVKEQHEDLKNVSILPTTDVSSVIRLIGNHLQYEDHQIDAVINQFVSNDYILLTHLLGDAEWHAYVSGRFRGQLKKVIADASGVQGN
jgi:thiol-disulfide isomerase/thioredoxin